MTRADSVLDGWARMYVEGRWTLDQFEAHVEAMLPAIPREWFDPEPEQSGRLRTPKEAAAAWRAGAGASAANYAAAINAVSKIQAQG